MQKSKKSGVTKKDDTGVRVKELENQLKKALADYHNLRREMDNRIEFEEQMLRVNVLRDLVELADDIDMAIDHVEDEKGWREGVANILEKFQKVMGGIGAEIIECKPGGKFDSQVHEAIGVVNEGKDGTISKVVQNGYKIGDKVVRPARVIVCKISDMNKSAQKSK